MVLLSCILLKFAGGCVASTLFLRRADGPSLSLAIPGGMEYAKNQDLVGINLVDEDIRQSTHHPFLGTGHTAAMPHAREFRQSLGCQSDVCDDLCGSNRVAIPDIAVNRCDVLSRLRRKAASQTARLPECRHLLVSCEHCFALGNFALDTGNLASLGIG
jgi:hypothetical protein